MLRAECHSQVAATVAALPLMQVADGCEDREGSEDRKLDGLMERVGVWEGATDGASEIADGGGR